MNCRTIFKLQAQRSGSFRSIWNRDGCNLDTNFVPLGMKGRGGNVEQKKTKKRFKIEGKETLARDWISAKQKHLWTVERK
jgi:hypothetical protein